MNIYLPCYSKTRTYEERAICLTLISSSLLVLVITFILNQMLPSSQELMFKQPNFFKEDTQKVSRQSDNPLKIVDLS